jgi:hypothetical protein
MQHFMRTWRPVAIVVGVLFAIALVWVVLLGPAALVLLTPRS